MDNPIEVDDGLLPADAVREDEQAADAVALAAVGFALDSPGLRGQVAVSGEQAAVAQLDKRARRGRA
jgi:hypothetical protein